METNILDQFDEDVEMVLFRYFALDTQAQFYAVSLRNQDIPCFLSNKYAPNMLPLGGSSNIALYVRKQDIERVVDLFAALDEELHHPDEEEEHSTKQMPFSSSPSRWLTILLSVILFIIFYFFLSRVNL
jgi:hypothetical protein